MLNEQDKEQFIEELKACGWNLGEWIDRKGRENESFTGLEIDPEKLKRLNTIIAICLKIKKADRYVKFDVLPLGADSRHGNVRLILPIANVWMSRSMLDMFSQLFHLADAVHLVAPALIADVDDDDEDDYDEDEEEVPQEDKIVLSFSVMDMWKMYGKAPF